jgi:hypothetical protein
MTDIAAMYTAAGNLIHEVSPEVLIICEGLGFAAEPVLALAESLVPDGLGVSWHGQPRLPDLSRGRPRSAGPPRPGVTVLPHQDRRW